MWVARDGTIRSVKLRYPVVVWTVVVLGVLLVAAEAYVILLLVRDPCHASDSCIDQGAAIPYTAMAFMLVGTPLVLIALGVDCLRSRIRYKTWRPPERHRELPPARPDR